MNDWRQHISIDPNVCHGRPCIAGTRVFVSIVLDSLADGVSVEELLDQFPSLTREGIQAALAYGAAAANEKILDLKPHAA